MSYTVTATKTKQTKNYKKTGNRQFFYSLQFWCGFYIIHRGMKLESDGVLIELRPLNERDSVARVFTCEYGIMVGVMRGGLIAKKNKPLVGQVGAVIWNARLDSQLGVFHWDASRNMAAVLMADARRLAMMNAAFSLINVLLPEREKYDDLYNATIRLLGALGAGDDADMAYLQWEVEFLRDVGYALDLSSCAGCGRHDNLVFMSPRTCRAVCETCGMPYSDRLYRLPIGMDVSLKLIEKVCEAQGVNVPTARRMLR